LGISNRKFISCMWVHLVVPFSHGFVFILCRSNISVSRFLVNEWINLRFYQ
jgi:hypothetical protein